MKNITTQCMDELGRIILPQKQRSALNWDVGDCLTAFTNAENSTITICRSHTITELSIDMLGRITLQKHRREELGWNTGEFLDLVLDVRGGTITLSPARKHNGVRCVFCNSSDIALLKNSLGICNSCVTDVTMACTGAGRVQLAPVSTERL